MEQIDVKYLETLLLKDFNDNIKNRIKGYCQRCYNIAKANSLNETLIKSMEQMYFDKFKLNINN